MRALLAIGRVPLPCRLVWAIGCVLGLGACHASPGDSSDGGGPLDAGRCSAPFPSAETPCTEITSSPARSCSLDAWPQYAAAAATDRTAAAGVRSTSVPGAPAGVLLSPDAAWVLVALSDGSGGGRLGVLRRSGVATTFDHAITLPAGETPFGLALSPDGVTVALSLSDEVAFFDLNKVEANAADALLGTAPTHSAMRVGVDTTFSRDGRFLLVATEYDRGVAVIDVTQRSYVGTIAIAGNAVTSIALSPDGARAYVTAELSDEFAAANPSPDVDQVVGSITLIDVAKASTDPSTAVLGRVFAGRAPVRTIVSPDGATAWVTVRGSNAVLAFDTLAMLANPDCAFLSATAVGAAPVGVALVREGATLFTADSDRFAVPNPDSTLSLVDTAKARAGLSDALLGQVGVGAFPREFAADAAALFVSNFSSKSLSGVDLTQLP